MQAQIDIDVRCQGWPDEASLTETIHASVTAATETAGLQFPDGAELSLVFTGDADMQEINRQWRGIDKPTNVLSFPAMPVRPGHKPGPMLGDIVLARETILREAAEQEKDAGEHLTHLLVHGFLHLLGYDHIEDEDAEAMETLETAILSRLGIADPYAGETV